MEKSSVSWSIHLQVILKVRSQAGGDHALESRVRRTPAFPERGHVRWQGLHGGCSFHAEEGPSGALRTLFAQGKSKAEPGSKTLRVFEVMKSVAGINGGDAGRVT